MEPLRVVFSVLLINGRKVASVPYFAVVEEVGPWSVRDIRVSASQVEYRLNSQGTAFSHLDDLLGVDLFKVGLVGIDQVGGKLTRPSSSKWSGHSFECGRLRQKKFVCLYVLVEGEGVCFGGRVVGGEEGEAEVMVFNRNVEQETESAHIPLFIIPLCLHSL